MVELKDKTVEELRKMASRKKIEGRSKMNKSELVRALKKKTTSTKKTLKRRKMKGGVYNFQRYLDVEEHVIAGTYVGIINISFRNELDDINTFEQLIAHHTPKRILLMNRNGNIINITVQTVGNEGGDRHIGISQNIYYRQNGGNYIIINFDPLLWGIANNNNNSMNWYRNKLHDLGLGEGQKLFPLINPPNQIPH